MKILEQLKQLNKTLAFVAAAGGFIGAGAVHSFPNSPVTLVPLWGLLTVLIYKLITRDIKKEVK